MDNLDDQMLAEAIALSLAPPSGGPGGTSESDQRFVTYQTVVFVIATDMLPSLLQNLMQALSPPKEGAKMVSLWKQHKRT